jgi:titin
MNSLLINNAIPTDSLSWTEQRQLSCSVDVDGIGTVAQDGNKYIQISGMGLGLSGRGAPRTVALGLWDSDLSLLANTANFSISASSSARLTEVQPLLSPLLINTTTTASVNAGAWILDSQAVYYQRAITDADVNNIIYDLEANTSISDFTDSGTLNPDNTLIGNLEYATVPSQAGHVIATPGNTNVSLRWSAPSSDGGSPITSYTIQRATNSSFTTGVVATTGIIGTSTVITGLTNGVRLWFRVAAVNAVATAAGTTGQFSGLVVFNSDATPTSPGRPGFPTNIVVLSGSDIPSAPSLDRTTSLLLQWTAANNNGATISSYFIGLTPQDGGPSISQAASGSAVSLLVTGLITNVTYDIVIWANNSVGVGAIGITSGKPVSESAVKGIIKRYDASKEAWIVVI